MTSPIEIPVRTQGATESESAMRALATAVAGLGTNVEQLGTKQQQQVQQQQAASASMTAAATQGIAFTQRISGIANAVQSLTSRLGSRDQTAGLVGSVASTTAQFASMGAVLGPQGALLGGLAGLAVAISQVSEQQTTAIERTHALADAQAALGRQVQETTHSLAAELVADENLYREHAAAVTSFWNTVTGNTAQALRQLRDDRAAIMRDQARLQERYDAGDQGANGLGGLSAGPSGPRFGALPTADDVTRLTGRGQTSTTPRPSGGGGAQVDEAAAARARAAEAQRIAAEEYAAILEQQNKLLHEQELAQQAAAEEAVRAEHLKADLLTKEAEQHRRYQEQLARAHEQERRWAEEESRRREQQTQEASTATSAVIGNLTNVFTLMAEGQANAAQGAELLLAGFLQYISQRATIEALAQVAAGIGSYPDFGGMALHFAAAAAWGAVAVATGVGGAALASDAQGQAAQAQSQAQEKPAAPQSAAGESAEKGATYVINWNAPIVTGQTEAQLGRTMRRLVDRSTQRYPTG